MDSKPQVEDMIRQAQERFIVESAEGTSDEDIARFFKEGYSSAYNAPEYADPVRVLARWHWLNRENPNIGDLGFPAWFCRDRNTGEIAAHLAFTPVTASVHAKSYPAVWARDLMVLNRWRKSGIFALLFHVFMEKMKNRTAFTMLGGAHDYVVARYKKIGYVHLGYLPLYVCPVSSSKILRRYVKPKTIADISGNIMQYLLKGKRRIWNMSLSSEPRNVAIRRIHDFDESFDVFWEKVSRAFPAIVQRDSTYLKWRFLNTPFWNYEIFKAEGQGKILGYIVLREGLSRDFATGVISDMLAHPEDTNTIQALIRFAQTYFSGKRHLELIRCDILGPGFERQLKKLGFFRIRSTIHFLVGNIRDGMDHDPILAREKWFMDYSDSDFDLWGRRSYPSSAATIP